MSEAEITVYSDEAKGGRGQLIVVMRSVAAAAAAATKDDSSVAGDGCGSNFLYAARVLVTAPDGETPVSVSGVSHLRIYCSCNGTVSRLALLGIQDVDGCLALFKLNLLSETCPVVFKSIFADFSVKNIGI